MRFKILSIPTISLGLACYALVKEETYPYGDARVIGQDRCQSFRFQVIDGLDDLGSDVGTPLGRGRVVEANLKEFHAVASI